MTNELWWLAPVFALIGALAGASMSAALTSVFAERRERRALFSEARVSLERWHATRNGPLVEDYEGLEPKILDQAKLETTVTFFTRHFDETFQAKAALGAIRDSDVRISAYLDRPDWKIEVADLPMLRSAISDGEARAMSWWPARRVDPKVRELDNH